jgi:hypothetical protein
VSDKHEIKGWWSFLLAVVFKPTWQSCTTSAVFLFLATATWIRDNFASEEWKRKLELKGFLPHIHPAWWLCIGLVILLFIVVRESHRLWKEQSDSNMELRKAEELRRSEPLPSTAPQVTLLSETAPELGKIQRLILRNLSPAPIFNLAFQPVALREDLHVIWQAEEAFILEGGQRMPIEPVLFRGANGPVMEFRGVSAIVDTLRIEKNSRTYDIGPVAFSCEDSVQNRYLVTFRVEVNFQGNTLTVKDCERVRIGSRPGSKG